MKKRITVFLLLLTLSAALFTLGGCEDGKLVYRYPDPETYLVGTQTYDADGITEISVSWIAGDVRVASADVDTVTVSDLFAKEEDGEERWQVRSVLTEGVLQVRFCAAGEEYLNAPKKTLLLTLPAELQAETTVSTVSANVTATSVSLDRLDVQTVGGNVTMTDVVCNRASATTVGGNVRFTGGTVGELSVMSVSGNADCNVEDVETAVLATVTGNCTLTLSPLVDYGGAVHTGGSVNDLVPCTVEGETYVYANGSERQAAFAVETVSGNVVLRLAE